jgi:hypothetical protein
MEIYPSWVMSNSSFIEGCQHDWERLSPPAPPLKLTVAWMAVTSTQRSEVTHRGSGLCKIVEPPFGAVGAMFDAAHDECWVHPDLEGGAATGLRAAHKVLHASEGMSRFSTTVKTDAAQRPAKSGTLSKL